MSITKIPGVTIYEPVKISGVDNIAFGSDVIIDSFAYIYAKKTMKIGNNVHVSSFVFLNGADALEIGDFCGFCQGAKIYTSTDDFKDWGFGNPSIDEKYRNVYRAPVVIGKFSVIGANSVVLPGVKIGEGATVGACSVVTKDLEPWGIYIGNRRVGERDRKGLMDNYEKYLKENS